MNSVNISNIIIQADCLIGLKELPGACIDSCVTDPPYGIRFMGKKWDHEVPAVAIWQQVLRVLKPGAHLLCACGTRSQHRMAGNIEEAGFEIRDVLCWHYGQGFPKSMDIGKAIDRAPGFQQKVLRIAPKTARGASRKGHGSGKQQGQKKEVSATARSETTKWRGWGTALKPATEFWTLARKPLAEKTIAQNIIKYGTGGLHIDAARVSASKNRDGTKQDNPPTSRQGSLFDGQAKRLGGENQVSTARFPANVILDEFMAAVLDEQSGWLQSGKPVGARKAKNNVFGQYSPGQDITGYGDSGGASRFFYVAKASPADRGIGNTHPTVKPLTLMRYLIRLICPVEPGRIVLDPFAGSGTTCVAARQIGLDFIAFELEGSYIKIAEKRLQKEGAISSG